MAEAHDVQGAHRETLAAAERDPDFFPLNDLPNDVLVSVFEAAEDPTWVRHTFPLVCKSWNELYCSEDASPLHETLELDFEKEFFRVAAAVAERELEGRRDPVEGDPPRPPVVHASRVISWARERAGSVRKLELSGYVGAEPEWHPLSDFSAEDLGALVAVVGPSLTDISIEVRFGQLCERPFWESLRTSVVPAGRLRSLVVWGIETAVLKSDVEPLAKLAGSLEELIIVAEDGRGTGQEARGLPRFPESFFALEKLRRLCLVGQPQSTAIPAGISSLKELEALVFGCCDLPLPKELGELSRLTKLGLMFNKNLGTALPAAEAFPAELGKMKSLRELSLRDCGFSAVPAFVCELKSLESLDLGGNDLSSLPKELGELSGLTKLDLKGNENLGTTAAAFPAELGKIKSLRVLSFAECRLRAVPSFVGELKSLESLDLGSNSLSSLPKELGELSGLTRLDLNGNENLGNTPQDEAFPAELGKMKSLRDLNLKGCGLRTVPAFVGELKSLESLNLYHCPVYSLPKELGELSRLTKLFLCPRELDATPPAGEAFPAELGKMKSLRELNLYNCGLSAVPAFVAGLKSLESLGLNFNDDLKIDAPLDFLIEGCPRLREVNFYNARNWPRKSLAHLKAFKAKLRARNPDAEVSY